MPVVLEASEYGAGKPVAILHGLFGSGRNWASIAKHLSAQCRVVAFDLRNHGVSPWAGTMDYAAMAEDIGAAMRARGHQRYALIGHSMGGKTAMVVALSAPETVERLVVVDIAPVSYPMAFLAYIRAMRALDLAVVTRRGEADRLLGRAIGNAAERSFLLQNLVFGETSPYWRLNLSVLETAMPTIASFPEFPSGTHFDGPTLFIGGGKSAALRPEHERAIEALFPNATITRIAEAGHWVHAEAPAAFLAAVEPFLARETGTAGTRRDAD